MTISAVFKCGEECGIVIPFFLTIIFLKRNIFVLRSSSGVFVSRYSHDLIAKHIAPISNHTSATCHGDLVSSNIFLNTIIGRAFCSFFDPSSFLYPLNCSLRRKQVLPSESNLGSGILFGRRLEPHMRWWTGLFLPPNLGYVLQRRRWFEWRERRQKRRYFSGKS